jgi:hypothetical protein
MTETYVVAFRTYTDARGAVDAVLQAGMREEHVNAIVQDKTVKGATDVDWETARTRKTDAVGRRSVRGLDAIVVGKDTVTTPDAGDIIAAGEVARVIANTAASGERGPATVEDALADSGVPGDVAGRLRDRLIHGGVVLVLRVEDDRGRSALTVLDDHHALDLTRTSSRPPRAG